MKSKSPLMALALGFFCINFCLPAFASGPARLDLVVEYGVDQRCADQARLAIDTAVNFFQNTYRLELERDLQIVLVPDRDTYRKTLIRCLGCDDNRARELAETSGGVSHGGTGAAIIVNLGKKPDRENEIFGLCHEIIHQFQDQESRGVRKSPAWLIEGVADALTAHILETAGLKTVDYKSYWQETIKKAPRWPRLENLHSSKEWDASMGANGPHVTYETAALAVLNLVQWKGYKPLFAYFCALKQTGPEDAFFQAFAIRISDFEKQFTPF
jgi:hypothetical protein